MTAFFRLFFVALVVAGIFVSYDEPINGARRLVGNMIPQVAPEERGARAAVLPLRVAIDLEARREGRRVAVLLDDWLYCYPKTGDVIRVPRGYETDFASIPKLARIAVNPFGNHAEAAVVHDWLYAVGEEGKRSYADEVFLHAMKEQNVNIVRRRTMYRTVRMGGNEAFGRENEWTENFRDPLTLAKTEPPIEKPLQGAVDNIGDCEELGSRMFDLLARYGT